MENQEHANGIKSSIEDILGAGASLRRKKKSEDDIQREKFEKIIRTLEEIEVRGVILGSDLQLDFRSYDDKFYSVIDALLELHFGKEGYELISFYLYERINPDGSINELMDENSNIVPLNTPSDLWELLKINQSKLGRQRKK
jgi:hypothetical protein